MIDQVASVNAKGLKATYIGRDQHDSEVKNDVEGGCYQIVYMSPEALLNTHSWREMFRSSTYQQNLACLAVDEAHLVDKWYA